MKTELDVVGPRTSLLLVRGLKPVGRIWPRCPGTRLRCGRTRPVALRRAMSLKSLLLGVALPLQHTPSMQRFQGDTSAQGRGVGGVGKRTLTEDPSAQHQAVGKRTLTEGVAPQAPGVPGRTASPATAATGPGAPLPDALRQKMERSLRAVFGDVRVHEASASAAAMGAEAYAQGNEIHFAPGKYDPDSPAGQELIGHELAHVVQQRQGRVDAPQGKGAPVVEDAALEAEADVQGRLAARGEPAGGAATPAGAAPASAPIQGKFQFDHNPQAAAPSDLYGHMRDDILRVMREAVEALAEDATQQQARTAVSTAFHDHNYCPAEHTLQYAGNDIFVRDADGVRVDKLGILADSNDPALYLQVPAADGDVNTLYINRSDGKQYVLDVHGRYTPRFQTRSITGDDKAELNHRRGIAPAEPEAGRTPAQHVGGMASQYLSITNAPDDVTNAHGVYFNAHQTGRIEVDLLQIEADNVVDLSTQAGARTELQNAFGAQVRDNFPAVWAAAQAQVRLIEAALPAGRVAAHQAAREANPGHGLTGMQWQQILDVCRTKEVLVAGGIPYEAVTSFGEAAVALQGGPAGDIAAHRVTANARTQAANETLAAEKAEVRTPRGQLKAIVDTRNGALKQQIKARWQTELGRARLQAHPEERGPRRQALNGAEVAGRQALAQLAVQYENKIAHAVIEEDAGIAEFGVAAQRVVTDTMRGIAPLPAA